MIQRYLASATAVLLISTLSGVAAAAAEVEAETIIQRCDLDTPLGKDQRSRMIVALRDADGNEKTRVYRRYWKAANGKKGILDKMVLFTEKPLDAKGTGFMRWNYLPKLHKNAEQWLYLPGLKTIRRVSVRDPGDSFLGSDMTYFDIDLHLPEDDKQRIIKEEEKDGRKIYVIETIPDKSPKLYSKIVSWYQTGESWSDCNKTRIEYFDGSGALLKVQKMNWQQVDGAWIWDEAKVENLQTGHSSSFKIRDVEINVGLRDRLFTERTLKRGVR